MDMSESETKKQNRKIVTSFLIGLVLIYAIKKAIEKPATIKLPVHILNKKTAWLDDIFKYNGYELITDEKNDIKLDIVISTTNRVIDRIKEENRNYYYNNNIILICVYSIPEHFNIDYKKVTNELHEHFKNKKIIYLPILYDIFGNIEMQKFHKKFVEQIDAII